MGQFKENTGSGEENATSHMHYHAIMKYITYFTRGPKTLF